MKISEILNSQVKYSSEEKIQIYYRINLIKYRWLSLIAIDIEMHFYGNMLVRHTHVIKCDSLVCTTIPSSVCDPN
jgi:hypothetical protein